VRQAHTLDRVSHTHNSQGNRELGRVGGWDEGTRHNTRHKLELLLALE